MSNTHPLPPNPAFQPERIAAAEQAGGALLALALAWLAGLAGWLTTRRRACLAPVVASSAIASGLLWVFRNPARQPASTPRAVLAPNDGLVRVVAMAQEDRFMHGPTMRITIQVGAGDVQATRAPHGGSVRLRRYEPAGPAHPSDDEIWLGIKDDAARIIMRQVASPLWRRVPSHWVRRILCWPDLEDALESGQLIGHLTLGGTVEVFVPATATIRVRAGQRVVGGETVLATL